MGHADTEWFDAFYGACEQLGCRSTQLKIWFFKYQAKSHLRFDYLAAHFYTATPQELMVILQDFSERSRKLEI